MAFDHCLFCPHVAVRSSSVAHSEPAYACKGRMPAAINHLSTFGTWQKCTSAGLLCRLPVGYLCTHEILWIHRTASTSGCTRTSTGQNCSNSLTLPDLKMVLVLTWLVAGRFCYMYCYSGACFTLQVFLHSISFRHVISRRASAEKPSLSLHASCACTSRI